MKLFYTLEEAAQRLGKTADQVREMAARGQLQEFRDKDRLVFKKEQVDLLAGGEEEPLRLADSGELEPIGLASSGSGPGINPGMSGTGMNVGDKDATGISLLDSDATDDADANAVTRISNTPSQLVDPGAGEKSKSGTGGLLDLTREADDTSLGAGLLEDVYGSETVASQTVAEGAQGGATSGALFETSSGAGAGDFESETTTTSSGAMVPAEAYDGPGSGLVGGLALGMVAALLVAIFTVLVATVGGGGTIVDTVGDNLMIVVGICAALPLVCGGIGFVLGKKG